MTNDSSPIAHVARAIACLRRLGALDLAECLGLVGA